jgi:hypothetical protein
MINTSGFQVRNMPRYTAPNPSLVAFTPQPIAAGMLDTFKLAQQYENLKASKALQAELESTRQARIAQQNALANFDVSRTGVETGLLQPRADTELASLESKRALLPAQTSAGLAGLTIQEARDKAGLANVQPFAKYEGEKIASDLSLLGPLTDARKAQAQAQVAEAGNVVALAPEALAAGRAKLGLEKTQAELGQQVAPLEAGAKIIELADKITNAKTDAERRRYSQELNMQLVQSQIAENLAQAKAMPRGVDPVQALGRFHTMQSQIINEQQKILSTKVPSPTDEGASMTLAMYLAATREPGTDQVGTERTGFLWRNKSNKKTNAEGERLALQLKNLDSQLEDIQNESNKFFRREIMPEPQSPVKPAPKAGKLEIKSIRRIE